MIAAIALDLGSTSIKAGLLRHDGTLIDIVSAAAPEVAVDGGHYESDALAYAATAEQVLARCLSQTGELPPLGLCSQRSSFLLWEKASGQPLTPLISWQDTRGAASCEALRDQEAYIREQCGLRLSAYYFAPKLSVLLQEHPQWHARLACGEYLVGTLDTFLIWRWTGGKRYVTDVSMAARTMLMDIRLRQWSPVLCDLFGIPLGMLAQIQASAGAAIRLDNGLMLQASLGDQSAAFFAGVGADRKAALVNLGTGGFVLRDTARATAGPPGYLRTLLYQERDTPAHIALEGTLNSIAAALAAYPVDECSAEEMGASDILCLAEPSGLGAPYFRSDISIRFSQAVEPLTPRQIAMLLLESIVFRVTRILEDFHHDSALERVYLCGGLSELSCLQQGIAQCAPAAVYRLWQRDASLCGTALLAAGMPIPANRDAARIITAGHATRLPEKYRRWKVWFDQQLDTRAV